MRALSLLPAVPLVLCGCVVAIDGSSNRTVQADQDSAAVSDAVDWREAERGILENHVQLTFADRFVKAGEAYFSPDEARIIFQAVEVPPQGGEADEFYAMYVAELARDRRGRITGLDNITRISPPDSANTCGWFHPRDPDRVTFGSTIGPPTSSQTPGYSRSTGRYRWMFPPEMRIVSVPLDRADGTAASLEVVIDRGDAYNAEGAMNGVGRLLVFCSLESGQGDLFIKDLLTGRVTPVVEAEGYDGGPFFSPEGRRLCYRSDRHGDHLLQLYVADLAFDEDGLVTGMDREYQLTANEHVNWCPFWHPDGRHLVYSTSQIGHHNYEIFLIDADPGDLPGSSGSIRYGTRVRRVTHAEGSDVLPVFNADGTLMMWTSRRGRDASVQLWVADFVMDLDSERGSNESPHGQR